MWIQQLFPILWMEKDFLIGNDCDDKRKILQSLKAWCKDGGITEQDFLGEFTNKKLKQNWIFFWGNGKK